MIVVELIADDVPRRHGDAALPQLAVGMLVEAIVDRLAEPDRRIGGGIEHRLDRLVLLDQPAIGRGIALGEFREFLAGAVEIAILREPRPVRKRHVHDDVGKDVFEPVFAELELVVAQRRAVLDDDVGGRAGVVPEPRQRQLFGDAVAADDGTAVEHDAAIARLGKIGRREQAVVAGPRDHDVETIGHSAGFLRPKGDYGVRAASAAITATTHLGGGARTA